MGEDTTPDEGTPRGQAITVSDDVFRALVARRFEAEPFDGVLKRELGLLPPPEDLRDRLAAARPGPVESVVDIVDGAVAGDSFVRERRGDPSIRFVSSGSGLTIAEIRFATDEIRVRCRTDYHGAMGTVARFTDEPAVDPAVEGEIRRAIAEADRRWG